MPLPTPNSSTGGYLTPQASPAPLQGDALYDFVQELVVGVTGMDGTMVRPRYQPEPANIPDAGDAWCAFGVGVRPSDTNAYVHHDPLANAGEGADRMQRQETLNVLASFYDLGSGGLADYYASLLRDGLQLPQNLEVLQAAGWGFVASGDLVPMPVLLKMRWQYRVDVELQFRRQIDRSYAILHLRAAKVIVHNDVHLPDIVVDVEPNP